MSMAAQQLPHKTTIKTSIDNDTRRMAAVLPTLAPSSDAECQETFSVIRSVVAEGYSIAEPDLPLLKYLDEDGDSCTLAACTVPDLLLLAKGGPLRLFADGTLCSPKAESQREEVTPKESQTEAQDKELTVADTIVAEATQEAASEEHHIASAAVAEEPSAVGAEEPSAAGAEEASAAAPEEPSTATGSIAQLVEMGFPEDKVRDALTSCKGDEQQAVEYLLHGGETSANRSSIPDLFSGLHSLLLQIKSRLIELREQLRPLKEAAGHQWERRREHRMHAEEEGRRRLKQLQDSIAELRVKLREFSQQWKGSAQGAAEKAKVRLEEMTDEAHSSFQKLDSQLEDAQHFLGDTLAGLHGRASGILQRVFSRVSNSEASEEEAVAAVDRAEAGEAVAAASESAALAAIDTVDEFLLRMGDPPEGDANPRMKALSQGAVQAQEFFARTFTRIQGKASEILMGGSDSTGSGTNDDAAADSSSTTPVFTATDVELIPEAAEEAAIATDVSAPEQAVAPSDTAEQQVEPPAVEEPTSAQEEQPEKARDEAVTPGNDTELYG